MKDNGLLNTYIDTTFKVANYKPWATSSQV